MADDFSEGASKMKNTKIKAGRLELSRETIRNLSAEQLKSAAGGVESVGGTCTDLPYTLQLTGCLTHCN